MQTIIVKTESVAHAKFLASFLKTISIVKQVFIEPENANVLREPAEEYNWVNPSRPSLDEEIEKMLDECEKGLGLNTEEAKAETYKLLDEWRQKRKK